MLKPCDGGSFMLALAFSLFVFAYWTLLGRAVIALAYPRVGVLRAWLLAPVIGLSIVLLGTMVLNQAGVPIRHFAVPLTVAFGVAAVGTLVWRRPVSKWRAVLPYFLAAVVALFWTAWPALGTGFNWISYANDDMANYCLAAQRFLDSGFYAVPTAPQLEGRDYACYYFFMHVADMMRFGAEHLVAWGAAVAKVKATQSFMPIIVALELVQIFAAGALVLHVGRWRRRALATVWLLAVSPLFMLGTLYQLIAQVGGLALLLVTLALLLRRWVTPRRASLIRFAVLPAITASALCIFYPEVTPFAALTFLAYAGLWWIRNRTVPEQLVALAAYTLLGIAVLLRHNLISYVSILVVQFNGAMNSANLLLSLFPYFMLPTGFSNLFGWMPIAHDFAEPAVSVTIVTGMVLTIAILGRAVREACRLAPIAILLIIQFALAVQLFRSGNDFGLYKMAMWMQPALVAGFAGWIIWWSGRRAWLVVASIALYAATAAPTALYYTDASRGLQSGGLTELRLASELGLQTNAPADPNAQLTSTIENVVAAKFAASELRGHPLALVSRDFFAPTTRTDFQHPTWAVGLQPHYDEMAQAKPLIHEHYRHLIREGILWRTSFTQPVIDHPTDYYVSVDPRLSVFNKFHLDATPSNHRGVFVLEAADAVHNRLLFVHSGLGNHYYLGDRNKISLFQQEPDLFAPGHEFNAIGRFMLLRIENPSPKIYLRLAATRTAVTGRTAWNPAAVVHGTTDLPLGAVGNGAFNLFIGPLTPLQFEGANYLAIDYKEQPWQLLDRRPGLKALYNRKVLLDYRRLLGWARDISAISEDEYAKLERPRSVSRFPTDLSLARGLEFSGAYEDGWLSPKSRFVFAGANPGGLIRLRGAVPKLPNTALGTGTVRVSVNGTLICEVPAPQGVFDWLLPVPNPSSTTTVELAFTASTNLPRGDKRPASAQLLFLGFLDAATSFGCDFTQPDSPRIAGAAIDHDGWMKQTGSLVLPGSDRPIEVVLKIEYPSWANANAGDLSIHLAGSGIGTTTRVVPGETPTIRLHLPASESVRTLQLDGPAEFSLPAPDSRRRALRILSVHVTAESKS